MEAEFWEIHEAQFEPDKLRALAIFDENLVDMFTEAWCADGGFIEAMTMLGLEQETNKKVLRLYDAKFRGLRSKSVDSYGNPLGAKKIVYDLNNQKDVEAFLKYSESCRKAVEESRDSVRNFIAKNCAIEDIL